MLCARMLGRAQFKPWGIKRTVSHIWLRLYLPMFWFNVGLFTCIKMYSLMVLACPCSSLPMMLKLLSVMLCPVCCMCIWMGEGCLRCSLDLSPRVLAVSPMSPHHRLCYGIGNCR